MRMVLVQEHDQPRTYRAVGFQENEGKRFRIQPNVEGPAM